MAMLTYITKEGDTVDSITWRQYQTRAGSVLENVLSANPGLADYGPVLPPGIKVKLPELPQPAVHKSVKLWN
ncbi:tail protein X [Oxalobacter vibrioformis]|uniref:Tail protein X n=1 Tax=Oxalobacter vibrioformis TaxID=933080 RepID=A0A9E9LU88_9BURK|nr:tail protein X [Oxalobacter vibrioformis]WAW09276.1 tail protein X [Oxalobacter vibrioformis]